MKHMVFDHLDLAIVHLTLHRQLSAAHPSQLPWVIKMWNCCMRTCTKWWYISLRALLVNRALFPFELSNVHMLVRGWYLNLWFSWFMQASLRNSHSVYFWYHDIRKCQTWRNKFPNDSKRHLPQSLDPLFLREWVKFIYFSQKEGIQ